MNYIKSSSTTSKGRIDSESFLNFFPYFLLNQHLSVLTTSNIKYFTQTLYVNKNAWARFFLLTKLSVPSTLMLVVDGAQFSRSFNNFVIQFNLSNVISEDRTSVYTNVFTHNFSLLSVSLIFNSCI